MTTSILHPNQYEQEYSDSMLTKKFIPTLKKDAFSSLSFEKTEQISNETNLKKISYLFPSLPIEKIEEILKKRSISLEEGLEQFKNLVISENLNKNNINKNPQKKFPNNFKKRNYLVSINETKKFYTNSTYKNFIQEKEKNKEKDKEIPLPEKKERSQEEEKERKKMELKTVDVISKELLESKNEDELREYLFDQLQLLDKHKRTAENIKKINLINQNLDQDKNDLRRSNFVVSRALNKKQTEGYTYDLRIKKLENEIENKNKSIIYYQYMGDVFKEEIEKRKDESK